jgi:hypothetical protein
MFGKLLKNIYNGKIARRWWKNPLPRYDAMQKVPHAYPYTNPSSLLVFHLKSL